MTASGDFEEESSRKGLELTPEQLAAFRADPTVGHVEAAVAAAVAETAARFPEPARPRRVQVIREPGVLPARVPVGAIYVGRAAWGLAASPFANPHRVGKPCTTKACAGAVHSQAEAVEMHYWATLGDAALREEIYRDLSGHDLACWCALPSEGEPDICHGATLLHFANDAVAR